MTDELLEGRGPLYRARCCRDWPVFLGVRMGRCGYCGHIPVVLGEWEATAS